MRRLLSVLLFLISTSFAFAQTATVTLSVTDTASQAWAGAYTFQLVPNPGQNAPPFYLNTVLMTTAQTTLQGTLSAGGATQVVSLTNAITPAGSAWNITVCYSSAGPCYLDARVTITGTQTISITPPAPTPGGGGSGNAQNALGTAGPNPQFSGYTFYVNSGTTYARNNGTGNIDYSGTDAAVVINNALGQMATTGGTLYFKNGTYNFNSATQETNASYSSLFYCIRIPATNTGNYPMFQIIGESAGLGSANNGVVFNVTAAAITAAGSSQLAAWWMQPSTYNTAGFYWNDDIYFQNVITLFPTNQRTNQVHYYFLEAAYVSFIDTTAAYSTAPSALALSGNTAFWGPGTPADGMSVKNSYCIASLNCFEADSDHTMMDNAVSQNCGTAMILGSHESRNANVIFHSSNWQRVEVYDCQNALLIGADLNLGVMLNIQDMDWEYTTTGTFPPVKVSGAVETTPGLTGGMIAVNTILTNSGDINGDPFFAPGNGGQNYTIVQPGAAALNQVVGKMSQSFTQANNTTWGPQWGANLAGINICNITSNQGVTSSGNACFVSWPTQTPYPDQSSKVTVAAIGSGSALVTVRASQVPHTQTYYEYVCTSSARTIGKVIAGVLTSLATVASGCSAADTLQLDIYGSNLYAYHNGVLDLTASDTVLTTGLPGVGVFNAGPAVTNWSGMMFPAMKLPTAATSLYTPDSLHGIPTKAFVLGSAYTNAVPGTFTTVIGSGGSTGTGLTFPVAASTNYTMHCRIVWQASAVTAGPEFQITGPASPTAVAITMISAITSSTTASAAAAAFTSALNPVGAAVTATTNEVAEVDMSLENGTTAGTVALQAEPQGTGTLTIEPGSSCTIQ